MGAPTRAPTAAPTVAPFRTACSVNDVVMRRIGKQIGFARGYVVRPGRLVGHELPPVKVVRPPEACRIGCARTFGCKSFNWIPNGLKGQCTLNGQGACDAMGDYDVTTEGAYHYMRADQVCDAFCDI